MNDLFSVMLNIEDNISSDSISTVLNANVGRLMESILHFSSLDHDYQLGNMLTTLDFNLFYSKILDK